MHKSNPDHIPTPDTSRKDPRRWTLRDPFRWAYAPQALKPELEAVLFSLKCFAAAMLALYLSFRIGLTRPFWALGTVYLVSQPFSGMSVSRGLFRLLGTVMGAAATVFLVPTFVNEPIALSMVLASWIGICLYIARLDRTPRAYAFQLSGYTTSLIGFPYLMNPGGIFTIASVRVQEISIGILCATLIHALILPRRVARRVQARVAGILADSEQWTRHMLGNARNSVLVKDRARAAVDMLDLHQLSTHLPFESGDGSVQVQILRTLHERLLTVLSLSGAIDDGLAELHASQHGVPAQLLVLSEQVRSWLDTPGSMRDPTTTNGLTKRLRSDLAVKSSPPTWRDLLIENLASDLAELVLAHQDCRVLEQRLKSPRPQWMRDLPERLLGPNSGYALHRDYWLAARSAIGAAIGITVSCALWIWTAWPDGATAVSLVGVACALFGTSDQPVGSFTRYTIGSIVGVAVGFVYGFAVLPRATDFVTLAAVLAPTLLASGCLLAKPLYAFAALGVVLTFPVIAGLGPTNASDFSSAANGSLALLIGSGMAVISLRQFQTMGTEHVTGRIMRAIRRDVGRRVGIGRPSEIDRWTSRMVDRVGLLVPRLTGTSDSNDLLRQALADVRTGNTAGELWVLEKQLQNREVKSRLAALLNELAEYFQTRKATRIDALLGRLDAVMVAVAVEANPVRKKALSLLSALRRDLSSRANSTES
ncbi:FUSC family protein [Cupriavidus sp. YAF13]|uniref:FUSC family protein n=1 Tax=Cupriavidus sp. YAF13 TaxID=3233075 RepID=UPI003F8E58BE